MTDVIIFNGALGSVLAIARIAKREKNNRVFVICLDIENYDFYKKSNCIDEVIAYNYNSHNLSFLEWFKGWYISKSFSFKPIMYFASDKSCLLINQVRSEIEEFCILCLPSSHIVQTYNEKGLAEIDAKNNGLDIPNTIVVSNHNDIEVVNREFLFPVILKPRNTGSSKSIGFKVKIVDTPEEFKVISEKILMNNDDFLCQEFIKGNDESAFFYIFYRNENGDIFSNSGKKILQSPPGQGVMAKGLLYQVEELDSICKNFLDNINYVGIGGIEFKKYRNKYYFIEMSTRLEGFFGITKVSNVNLGLVSYFDLSKRKFDFNNRNSNTNGRYVDLYLLTYTRIKNKQLLLLLKEYVYIIFNRNYYINVFDWKDFKPFCKLFFK
ncbi:ATP-grasp domain-containing protein [Myroides odoratus]|uniref:ATP-grasp domain-containing protein n=1 Tax=Myroides odoratus TaxID=256 RepID=A0A9Q6Z5D2_MYROD|nr:ATP-grasp domain-containing protein [Myroides odoratus]EHQ43987.1 hypothetical protein Myrod_3171 [Myroides odoratus DSM 2801]EKB05116.1 hypothetical protein HMPREF9716_02923 [Myroides odoratus CIP 103059]QQU01286.1 ATP-grasp domain-containing protein [Myroides odoratus]WQD56455.1 ATP-grasp domain-containing protein [Myroides odoratus]STZ31265.1 carbamoyl phosphate synthase-like protein [Myroides odoratus]